MVDIEMVAAKARAVAATPNRKAIAEEAVETGWFVMTANKRATAETARVEAGTATTIIEVPAGGGGGEALYVTTGGGGESMILL